MEFAKIGIEPSAIIITEYKSVRSKDEWATATSKQYWNKILVYDTYNFTKDTVIYSISKAVEPLSFLPYKYEESQEHATFLVHNCPNAIHRLCLNNLVIKCVLDDNITFKLAIILRHSAVDERVLYNRIMNINSTINCRFDNSRGILDLSRFHEDPNLEEYTPLYMRSVLLHLMQLCKVFIVKTLILSDNRLNWFPASFFVVCRSIRVLNLRNNLYESLKNIAPSPLASIKEVWLDGNPLCEKYDVRGYIKDIKGLFPNISQLDGVSILNFDMLPLRKNFLCDLNGENFIDQFLEFYFKVYDSPKRYLLIDLYDENAFFSLTKHEVTSKGVFPLADLSRYQSYERNLKFIVDFSKGGYRLWHGNKTISYILQQLPSTEHDPYSFSVDLVHYNESTAIVTLTGVFRHVPVKNSSVVNFSRTFVISTDVSNRCKILNDQFHINNIATTTRTSFSTKKMDSELKIPIATTLTEKKELIYAFSKMTTLKVEWCKRYLEDHGYDLSKTLKFFIDSLGNDKIEKDAFERNTQPTELQPIKQSNEM